MPKVRLFSWAVLSIVLLCICLFAAPPQPALGVTHESSAQDQAAPQEDNTGADEIDSQPIRAYRVKVRSLFDEEKFDQLEEIAGTARSQKERFRGGEWKLRIFYLTIQGPGSLTSTDAAWDAHIERLQRWIAAKPNSITPRVALAQAYLRLAWKARGNGYANTVTSSDWKLFAKRVQKAQETLQRAETLDKDPQWYRDMQTVALAQGWDRARADDLLKKASNAEPDYFYFYTAHANYLLPKWQGKPGESENFAETISHQIGGQEGDFIYFMLALELNCCKGKRQLQLSWDQVKQGFAALEQLYASTNREVNAAAYMAVREGDRGFAQELFTRIGDNWDESVWHSKEIFNRSKAKLSLNEKPQALPAVP